MKRRLAFREIVTVASMLFGLFFGAGNLIFPALMGQMAGQNMWHAVLGFLISGAGLPLLSIAALGISHCDGLLELGNMVGKRYSLFLTCVLYLTIGPFFAIPRCAAVPFETGIAPLLTERSKGILPMLLFTLLFFLIVIWFSLRPNGILTWVGKILNPVFLLVLGVIIVTALLHSEVSLETLKPTGDYAVKPFFTGLLEGYNTMDALAGLAFGIIVVNVIKRLGITEPGAVASNTVKAGIFSCLLMAVIYISVTMAGVQSRAFLVEPVQNGGQVLAAIARQYFGNAGMFILTATVILACLKTAIGLITCCAETFSSMFPTGPKYTTWAIIFCSVSFLIANLGLNSIIAFSLPVLYFLYPLAITLIILSLLGRFFQNDPLVYRLVTGFVLVPAFMDFCKALPAEIKGALGLDQVVDVVENILPLFHLGLGWVLPAILGLLIGLLLHGWRLYLNKA